MPGKKKRQSPRRAKVQVEDRAAKSPANQLISIVGVGASAGGLEAFEQLLAALPADSGMAFVLVQHLAPKHESLLSELLRKSTKMRVVEVTEGMKVEANRVYVIPPAADMSIAGGVLHLSPMSPDRGSRMPIDSFFRSLAEDQQGRAIGVILSGTASDGTLGLQTIKAMGGVTFAQDEETAKYSAMPRNAIAAGNVDFVLPPNQIAREIQRIGKHVHVLAADDQPGIPEPKGASEALDQLLALLRNKTRVDFNLYKPGTIRRRITRRMFLRKIDNLPAYFQYVRKHPEEIDALFRDVLINVTGFFRDPEAFDALRKQAFPLIMNGKGPNSPIRIWVPGCSTGEEAYSLAIAFLEFLGDKPSSRQVQVFATDVSDAMIQKARTGIYPDSIALDMTPERLRRHFQKSDGGYQISKSIRDMCVFAKQDVAKDPPFSKLDMISCRNVMIYMEHILQEKILPLFHYALNPGGVLFLGSSETVGSFGDMFAPLDKKYRIYIKKSMSAPTTYQFPPQSEFEEETHGRSEPFPGQFDLQKIADRTLLERYAPATVMVNEKLEIVQFIGHTGTFLEPAPGGASLDLLKMVKSGLHMELRLAFQKVKRGGTFRKEGVLVEHNGALKAVNFEIIAVKHLPKNEKYYLVVFEEDQKPELKSVKSQGNKKEKPEKQTNKGYSAKVEKDNASLREELDATREYLQSIIEEQRTTNEELRSANEEIQSSNEELQSINEELETAKEELQSTNEELTTVNEEMQNRNDELTQVNSDLNNLLGSVNIPVVMLGRDLRIRRFTALAEKIMNLIPADIGRPITDIKSNLRIPDLPQLISQVVDTLETHEKEVEDNAGRWYSMRIRPYRTVDNKIDGVVVLLLELDPRLRPKRS